MDGLLNVTTGTRSRATLTARAAPTARARSKATHLIKQEWTATAPSLQEWMSCRRRTTQATPLPMKLVVARVPKEEENAAPSDAGAEPPANEAVFQVVAPTQTDEDGDALFNFDDESGANDEGLLKSDVNGESGAMACLQEWASRRRRTTRAAPLLMKMFVVRAQKEEEDAARLSTRGQIRRRTRWSQRPLISWRSPGRRGHWDPSSSAEEQRGPKAPARQE